MAKPEIFRNKWALVTGASAGIGVAIARELASHGAKLILTARRRDRLEAFAAELAARGTEVRIVVADLTDLSAPQAIYDATEGAGLQVDILINNAGHGQYGAFESSDLEKEVSQIQVNCVAVAHLSRLFLPPMVARRRGWVMVVASMASFQPVPFLSTYAATKGFDRYFALGIAEEVAPYGVKVSALCPGPTDSEFFEVAGASAFRNRGFQTAEEVASAAVNGLAAGKRTVIPYFAGKANAFVIRFLPVGMITWMVAKVIRPKAGQAA